MQEVISFNGSRLIKNSYTEEENFRAYQLFSMMDKDLSGKISFQEFREVLLGENIERTYIEFDYADCGIIWELDEDNCVVLKGVEKGSPAESTSQLVRGLKLLQINDELVPQHDPSALEFVTSLLEDIYDDPVSLEFLHPLVIYFYSLVQFILTNHFSQIVINSFSAILDIEVEEKIYSIALPVGAVNNVEVRMLIISTTTRSYFLRLSFRKDKFYNFFK